MDVHPPHGAIHSWRDFFVHLATITIGLLIALGLEAMVEWFHHRHLVDEARENIREEILANQKHVAGNLAAVKTDEQAMDDNIKTLLLIRAGKKLEHASLTYSFRWNDLDDSAWKTAQSSGAMIYIDFRSAQNLAEIYRLQEYVSVRQAAIQWDHSLAVGPLYISGDPDKMTPQEAQLSLQRTADLKMNLNSVEQVLAQVAEQYKVELGKL
jgi:hypothetical protein